MKTKIIFLVLLLLSACEKRPDFQQSIAKPDWFESASSIELNSPEDVSKLWQSEKRCCESKDILDQNNQKFYKSCYQAIVNHPQNDELVVKCLWLMDNAVNRDQRIHIQSYLLENYRFHKSRVNNCANCAPADVIVRVTMSLAREVRRDGDQAGAIELVESILKDRETETSLWIQTEVYKGLAEFYLADKVTETRGEFLTRAYKRLERAFGYDKTLERRFPAFEKVYFQVMARIEE
ncbi:MAG: hypothetical protein OEY96_04670 [Gammaproteobacteria bacterium]|nr:hypothetical protein [Gammaproteobacteria bacterium]